MKPPVPYSDAVETVPPDEGETIEAILASLRRLRARERPVEDPALRVSHAKMHGLAVGELTVLPGLAPELAQGLFAAPRRFDVIARLANVPGELVTDAVNTQRGLALKVLGVEGEKIAGHEGDTQDFVLDTGPSFGAPTAKAFLMTHRLLEHAPRVPAAVKVAVSAAARAANAALGAVGGWSPNLDLYGSPRVHPLAEAYFSQAPYRYGAHVAKIAVVPVGPEQARLADEALDTADPDALRTATVSYLQQRDALFEVRVQLCVDLDAMPVEDASAAWDEGLSPYRPVATLRFPKQDAMSPARAAHVDALSFSPAHALAAHRPLGGIMRARLRAYPEMARARLAASGRGVREPAGVGEVLG